MKSRIQDLSFYVLMTAMSMTMLLINIVWMYSKKDRDLERQKPSGRTSQIDRKISSGLGKVPIVEYPKMLTLTLNQNMNPIKPLVKEGLVENYAITPDLPHGLQLNSTTGEITGKAPIAPLFRNYKITARNQFGRSESKLFIVFKEQNPLMVYEKKAKERQLKMAQLKPIEKSAYPKNEQLTEHRISALPLIPYSASSITNIPQSGGVLFINLINNRN